MVRVKSTPCPSASAGAIIGLPTGVATFASAMTVLTAVDGGFWVMDLDYCRLLFRLMSCVLSNFLVFNQDAILACRGFFPLVVCLHESRFVFIEDNSVKW